MLRSWVEVELTSADVGAFLRRLTEMGIEIRDVTEKTELTIHFRIPARSLRNAERHCRNWGGKLTVLRMRGTVQYAGLIKRPVLICGTVLLLLLALWIPEHILFFSVEGNSAVPQNQILEAAANAGIRFGISRREIRSEPIKNRLLAELPELKWVGINTYGSLAVISVREREPETKTAQPKAVTSIVAARDGIVLTCTATKGTAMTAPGQTVKKDQVLISGYSDLGLTISATRAEGDVYAATTRSLSVKTPETGDQVTGISPCKRRFSLRIGKKRINFYKCSGILGGSCVKMKREYVLTLPGGLSLPIALIEETVSARTTQPISVEPDQIFEEMKRFVSDYLCSTMIAGQIAGRSESVSQDSGITFRGIYSCHEMIGRVRDEEIGVYNGKTD